MSAPVDEVKRYLSERNQELNEENSKLRKNNAALLEACKAGGKYRDALEAIPVRTQGGMVVANDQNNLDELFFEWESKSDDAIKQAETP